MLGINPISRNVLITPDECTAKLANSSIDSHLWASCIEVAESKFVLPLLGWDMYQDICTQKNVVVTSGNIVALQVIFTAQFGTDPVSGNPKVILTTGQVVNGPEQITTTPAYATLWNQALWNFTYQCVYALSLPGNYAQFTSSGIQKNNPLDSAIGTTSSANVGISLNDLRFLVDNQLLDRINSAQNYLEWYLCANAASYPKYPTDNCEKYLPSTANGSSGLIPARASTFINIYEDEDRRGNRTGHRWGDCDCINGPFS